MGRSVRNSEYQFGARIRGSRDVRPFGLVRVRDPGRMYVQTRRDVSSIATRGVDVELPRGERRSGGKSKGLYVVMESRERRIHRISNWSEQGEERGRNNRVRTAE